jgi:hypothetical protein
MSSSLELEEQMYSLEEKKNQYSDKLKETQNKFGSMTHAIYDLIAFCKIQLAKEELANELTEELVKELAEDELAKDELVQKLAKDELVQKLAKDELVKELAKDELVKELAKDELV